VDLNRIVPLISLNLANLSNQPKSRMKPKPRTQEEKKKKKINLSLPHVRGCVSSKPSLPGPKQRDLHQAVSLIVSQQGALSRAGERNNHSSQEDTDDYPAVEVCMLMVNSAYTIKPNSSAVLIGPGEPVSQQFLRQIVTRCVLDCEIYRLRTTKDEFLF
jgi:hypothetical protein